jgi:hypothetical protein
MRLKMNSLVQCVSVFVASLSLSSCGLLSFGSNPDLVETDVPSITDVQETIDPVDAVVEEPVGPPTAKAVPGRSGFVFNPFTGNIVDVRGLSEGLLVRDPQDSDRSHTFRVPAFE